MPANRGRPAVETASKREFSRRPPLHAMLLLARDGRLAATQHELLNLASRRLGQLRHENELARHLEMRQTLASEGAQFIRGRMRAGPQHDEGMWRLRSEER